jgi:hypothetical protein
MKAFKGHRRAGRRPKKRVAMPELAHANCALDCSRRAWSVQSGFVHRPQTDGCEPLFPGGVAAAGRRVCWLDRSSAVEPLAAKRIDGMPETYPFGI